MMGFWNIKPPNIKNVITQNRILEKEIEPFEDKRLVVVSVFGSSELTSSPASQGFKKAFQLAVDAFGSLNTSRNSSGTSEHQPNQGYTTVSGFYNEEESLLILSLDGGYDQNVLLKAFQVSTGKSFMALWAELKSSYCQALFLLFSLSHVMILSSLSSYFDTSLIGLFRALETLRNDMYSHVSELLRDIPGLPAAWVENARLCSPRLLFLFPVENTKNRSVSQQESMSNLKAKLENDIYQILRKCRIITNVSGHSLFALPVEQEETDFVFLYDETRDDECNWAQYIRDFCNTSNERVAAGLSPRPTHPLACTNTGEPWVSSRDYATRFRKFLLTHIKLALGKGFDDNAPKVSEKKLFFTVPKLGQWIKAFQVLWESLCIDKPVEHSQNKALRHLPRYLDVDGDYLESQCSKNFHRIFTVYTKNLPSHYSEEEHGRRVNQAIDAFLLISRAPGIVPWLEKLAEKCERYWKRGRQQCQTLSLHRHLCTNPLHQVEPEDHLEVLPHITMDENLPKMRHSTGNRLTSYCNCGRRSGIRDEPFTIREANYDFYQRLALDCCEKLDGWKVPIFEPVRDEEAEGPTLQEMLQIFLEKRKQPTLETEVQEEEENDEPASRSQALERDLRQEEDEEDDAGELEEEDDFAVPEDEPARQTQETLAETKDSPESVEEDANAETEKVTSSLDFLTLDEKEVEREPGNEYLPGMLHTRCPPGLLPLFPSWSLLRFGSSSVYAHSTGILYQPGFLASSAYLLPWDVLVKAEEGVSKPVPRMVRGKAPSRRLKRIQDEFPVKVFIGFEYECRKGHRFMLESADKVLHLSNPNFGPNIREAARKAATSDMPLYFDCPCNTQVTEEPTKAQLMRVHVVTPKAPVHVQLNPRVQPGQGGPYFTPGNTEPIKLAPSVYWVLRLPYAYVTDEQIYTPPTDKNGYNGRICKGLLDVVSMSQAETVKWELAIANS